MTTKKAKEGTAPIVGQKAITTVTKVGYTPILRGSDYGARVFDDDNGVCLFETRKECEDVFAVGEDDCIAIATVTWEEPA